MSSVIGVTAGGIDVSSIVTGFMAIERQPVDRLITKQSAVKLQSDAIIRLRNSFEALKSASASLVTSGISKYSVSSSNSSVAQATLGSFPASGTISFTVDRLAKAQGMRMASTVSSTSAVVTTASSLALSTTTTALGLGAAAVDPVVAAGKYTVTVTQSSVGAIQNATSAPTAPLASGTLEIMIGASARTLNLTGPLASAADMVSAVQAQINATGGGANASLDGTGRLRITTMQEGSAATLQITGGTAMAGLGFSVGSAAGTDGKIQIGANAVTTVTSAGVGGTASVATGSGNLTFDVNGGLRAGTATVAVVSTGDRSLTAVAAAVNGANIGATASSVKVSEGNWLLQLNSKSTGANGALAVHAGAFAGLGGFLQTSAAEDARITIGSGPGAYSITSSSNIFSDVMSGVSLTAVAESATAVTVSVGRDDSAAANAVEKFVGQVTSMLADIKLQTGYDPATKKASPLTTNAGVRGLATEIRSAITSMVDDLDVGLASSVGITVTRSGNLAFDKAKFITAMTADSAAVERLFGRGGSSAGGVTFGSALDSTVAGTYDVAVTTAATRATTAAIVGVDVAGKRIGIRVGSVTATYDVTTGATDAVIAAGLNASMSAAGIKVSAEVTGGGVVLTAASHGTAGSFETNVDTTGVGTWSAITGVDVVGTINGQAAVGVGNTLSLLDVGTNAARGLKVQVDGVASGATVAFTYAPGLAARIVNLANGATGEGGVLTSSAASYDNRFKAFNTQIDRFEARLVVRETAYRRQWTGVQTMLSSMQNQQNWLTSQVNSLSGNR